ncbi:MAG: hypothetical protein EBQ80_01835 [Proteobacteria bacterium]|nr:hypothetical protein [Pseudomonadota bacterium]
MMKKPRRHHHFMLNKCRLNPRRQHQGRIKRPLHINNQQSTLHASYMAPPLAFANLPNLSYNPINMILLPRPAPHLPRIVATFQQAGITNLLPLALSHPKPLPIAVPPKTTALILTSSLALPAVKHLTHLPAYCVGPATAQAAQQAGFTVAHTGTNNAASLATEIRGLNLPPQNFLHPHGNHTIPLTSFFPPSLHHSTTPSLTHTYTPLLAYQTQRITTLPTTLIPQLQNITTICLFSAGSTTHLAKLLKPHQHLLNQNLTTYCFSPAVTQAAHPFFPNLETIKTPSLTTLLQTIKNPNKNSAEA